jgi:hypothetical protein
LNNDKIIDILGEATYEDLINTIEGLWVLDTHNYTQTV